jgi:hypothetical protein
MLIHIHTAWLYHIYFTNIPYHLYQGIVYCSFIHIHTAWLYHIYLYQYFICRCVLDVISIYTRVIFILAYAPHPCCNVSCNFILIHTAGLCRLYLYQCTISYISGIASLAVNIVVSWKWILLKYSIYTRYQYTIPLISFYSSPYSIVWEFQMSLPNVHVLYSSFPRNFVL